VLTWVLSVTPAMLFTVMITGVTDKFLGVRGSLVINPWWWTAATGAAALSLLGPDVPPWKKGAAFIALVPSVVLNLLISGFEGI